MKKRLTEEQIIGFLREAKSGLPVLSGRLLTGIECAWPLGCRCRRYLNRADLSPGSVCLGAAQLSLSLKCQLGYACQASPPYGCLCSGASMPAVLP